MKYLLDTDHISFLQRRSGLEFNRLTMRMARYAMVDFAVSVISFHEQVLGAHSYINRARTRAETIRGYALLLETLQGYTKVRVLPFDIAAVAVFEALRKQRVRISTMDLRIAAIALSQNLVLLTRNIRDFSKVPNLVTEDWTI